jgi:hypothetical protein
MDEASRALENASTRTRSSGYGCRTVSRLRLPLVVLALLALAVCALPGSAKASYDSSLRRYPYLTDLVKRSVTVNWATTTSITSGSVRYGKFGSEDCTAHSVTASKVTILVGSTTEYQWKARLPKLTTNTMYCYRVYGGTTDLLGSDPTPTFRSRVPAHPRTSFSFAVFGDWGEVDDGTNSDQARLMAQIADSGAQFAVNTGDTAYDGGSQTNYGDLVQTGDDTSAIFGDEFWTVAGDQIAMFNVQGNHGLNSTALVNWPQDVAVSTSGGRYQMETYCCDNGTDSVSYPSSWYAFNAGPARFYVLEAAWGNTNVGDADLYENDYDAHWTTSRAEYQWLENDLQTRRHALAFAFFHFPLYADNASETSDPWLHGSGHLEELLGDHGVDIVFNGHAHLYERNLVSAAGMPITYVTGGGGGHLEPVSGCTATDAYAIGWSYSSSTHGSACGAAPRPTTIDQVFHFLLVTVDGTTVTVTPTDELGRTFDVQTYDLS